MKKSSLFRYDLCLAEFIVPVGFQFLETAVAFGQYIRPADSNNKRLCIDEKDWKIWQSLPNVRGAAGEFSMFAGVSSEYLLHFQTCLIHAVAFCHNNQAWLIVGPSGVGKSTQFKTLKTLYPDQFSIICGDRPILKLEGERIVVHPSPWNGKEGWHGEAARPLEGIILLTRGDENVFAPVSKKDAVLPVYSSLITHRTSDEVIRLAASFAEKMLQRIPVYRLINKGVPDSTRLLYEALFA